ncbi:MerR family transcriptional regulator [Enterococcus sp. DIV0660C]|uniref:MerR family transcriptional regulator n=1 Tax=Enterococcus sp. DIV0660C TaxID=2230880 RepID=UPI001A8D5425|nr:MerR family transcriptional regulator [Enterococcus sp. DIV0660C]MBO0432299.1 MerR family transcriptional regulator [Enterococcus sp. DIV0660C]
MEYTIKKIAELSGVSPRTLRFYDEIGLLKPAKINSSGYRIYGAKEIDRLQQILFYRSLEFKLEQIQELLNQPDFDQQQALRNHQQLLLKKRAQIDALLTTVQKTLTSYEGGITMSDQEKFEGFKQQKISENEEQFGQEIREKYGEKTVEEANQKWANMTEQQFQEMQVIEEQLLTDLATYLTQPELDQPLAKAIFDAHKEWLAFSWSTYTPQAHQGLGQMYLADERFTAYYDDRSGNGATKALNEIIQYYTNK